MKKELLVITMATLLSSSAMAANTSDTTTTTNDSTATTTVTATNTSDQKTSTTPKTVKQKVPKTQMVTLESSQVFKVKLEEGLSTKSNKVGDYVPFTVVDDVMVDNVLVVPAGTTGQATVSAMKKARSFGRNASLDLSFDNIQAIDGTTFAAMQGTEAQEKTKSTLKAAGASVAGVALLGPVGVVGGFFVKGKSVEYPAGTEVFIQPTGNVSIVGQVPGQYEEIEVPASSTDSTSATDTDTTSATNSNETTTTATNKTSADSSSTSDATNTTSTDSTSSTSTDSTDSTATNSGNEEISNAPIVVVKRTE